MIRKKKKPEEEKTYLLDANAPFHIQEAYKNLRTNVQFSLPSGDGKVIGITSAERGDGKSTTAINLAIAFAQIGKRVTLIDGDLRMPTVAKKLGIPGTPGVSNYIAEKNALSEVCKKIEPFGMYVMPSGNIPPDATWLLQSEAMERMLCDLKKAMDYIFIDLPPVTVVSDAMILSKLVDGYLVIVQTGATSKKNIANMIASMQFVDAKILGFVNTRSDGNNKGYYYKGKYQYSYQYRYEYRRKPESPRQRKEEEDADAVDAIEITTV